MKRLNRLFIVMVFLLTPIFVFAGIADALDIILEPANVQREVGGKVRVHIYADNAVDLISMGVKVSFDPSVLQVQDASKYENVEEGWVMDVDGDSATTDDQYTTPPMELDNTNGTVTMIGGRLTGSSTQGLSGKVLLGWIVFEAIADGTSQLSVDLGKYHPNPGETFVNFATLDQGADEPTNVPADLGAICVLADACEGDMNGNGLVAFDDYTLISAAWASKFGDENYNPACDLDADGLIKFSDYTLFSADWKKTCSCPY
ncbi:hypothetical protein [Desulfobacter latus]|uniref:Cohesin domain-containing protein n=1 Tax=Desulfobacter latus TaxID=2292 RepID=A0A850SYI5_9BACT|nr:hypothetical protein [Desulfobacter latus]NWH04493.1 hypothetical protein [Desulfobacter latus]